MEKYYGIAAIVIICILVLFMGTIKQKSGAVTVFVLRSFVGAIGICITNEILASQGISVSAGINPVTVLTIGTLGISGFALIYGILFYKLL